MTTTDRWLLERAEKLRTAQAETRKDARSRKSQTFLKAFDGEIEALWTSLIVEVSRQAEVFNKASGQPKALLVTGDTGHISVAAADGRRLQIVLDRKTRTLLESYRNSAGATRIKRPRIGFRVDSAGKLAFNFGVVQSAAGSILRRVID